MQCYVLYLYISVLYIMFSILYAVLCVVYVPFSVLYIMISTLYRGRFRGEGRGPRTPLFSPKIHYEMLVKFKIWDPKYVIFFANFGIWILERVPSPFSKFLGLQLPYTSFCVVCTCNFFLISCSVFYIHAVFYVVYMYVAFSVLYIMFRILYVVVIQ
jgi:hypothetical protein